MANNRIENVTEVAPEKIKKKDNVNGFVKKERETDRQGHTHRQRDGQRKR